MKNKIGKIIVFLVFIAIVIFLFFLTNKSAGKNVNSTTLSELPESKIIDIVLNINDGNESHEYKIRADSGITVFDLLKNASQKEGFSLQYKESGPGVFIDEIFGVKNDNEKNKFWTYKVNDVDASIGASDYKIDEDSKILWEYKEF